MRPVISIPANRPRLYARLRRAAYSVLHDRKGRAVFVRYAPKRRSNRDGLFMFERAQVQS